MLAAGLLAGCAEDRTRTLEAPAETQEPEQNTAAGEAEAPSGDLGVPLATLVQGVLEGRAGEVLDRLRPPGSEEVETLQNRHDPEQVDTLRTLHYDGLTVEVYHVGGGSDREFIQSIEVTGGDYETAEGVQVGSTRTRVEEQLGSPATREGDAYVYELSDVTPNQLRIRFDGDTVSAMTWSFYVD